MQDEATDVAASQGECTIKHTCIFPHLLVPLSPSFGNILWLSGDEGAGRSVFADPGVGPNRLTGARGAFKYPCVFILWGRGPCLATGWKEPQSRE